MRLFSLIAGCVLCAMPSAQAQETWTINQTCLATTPAPEPGQPQLSVLAISQTNESRERKPARQLRLQTSTALLANGEKLSGVTVSIPQQQDFSDLNAMGIVRGKVNVIAIEFPADADLLRAVSRGSNATITVPLPAGPQSFTFDLAGSGKAMKQISPCVE